jgi:hypothetical protein
MIVSLVFSLIWIQPTVASTGFCAAQPGKSMYRDFCKGIGSGPSGEAVCSMSLYQDRCKWIEGGNDSSRGGACVARKALYRDFCRAIGEGAAGEATCRLSIYQDRCYWEGSGGSARSHQIRWESDEENETIVEQREQSAI